MREMKKYCNIVVYSLWNKTNMEVAHFITLYKRLRYILSFKIPVLCKNSLFVSVVFAFFVKNNRSLQTLPFNELGQNFIQWISTNFT